MSTAVNKAAKLKPEIRLAQALSEYCACLGESRAREFKNLRTTSPPTPQDVITLTEEINRNGSRNHKAWRPYATRTAMFLDKVQTLSRIGDFLVGSSQNLMASGIWATVKITLGIAVGSLSFFKRISELFLKVGRASSITRDLVEVFPNSNELQDLMCEYLIVLVYFCKDVVRVLNKPTIFQLSSPFIAFFDKEASKFEIELSQLSTAIDRKMTVLLSQSQVESANTISRMGRTLSQWSTKSEAKKQQDLALRSSRLQDKLSSPIDQHQRIAAWRRQRKKGDVRWLFKEHGYNDWLSANVSSDVQARILHISGKLGSGKTVLLANIVAELHALRAVTELPTFLHWSKIITFFFCDDDYADLITVEQILGSIFQQILGHLEPSDECVREMDRLYRESDSSLPSLVKQVSILASTWPQQRSVYIVVDGLDRCKKSVVEEVIDLLLSIPQLFPLNRPNSWIHLCFSSRPDSPIKKLVHRDIRLSNSNQFTITNDASKSEMKEYVEAEFERRREIRKLDKDLENIIRDVLVGASEGMYLWVALQIEALFPLDGSTLLSPSDILRLLDDPPKDLAEAFNNALQRISDTRYGKTIFQLIATPKRPLTISELKIALHVKPGDTDWTSITLSLPQDERAIVGLCGGGLLEIDEEDNTVRFIHHSVAQHLQQPMPSKHHSTPYHFREYEADMHMGFICTTYLNYSIFNTSLSSVNTAQVNPDQFTNKITEAVSTASASTGAQVAARVIAAITRKRNLKEPRGFSQENIKIGQLLQKYMQPKVETSEIMAFSNYAHEHWTWHSTRLWVMSDTELYHPFKLLLASTPDHVTLPWDLALEIPDKYPERRYRRYSTSRLATDQSLIPSMGTRSVRWAQANRHFGILFELLAKPPFDASQITSYIYRLLLRRIFLEAYRLKADRVGILEPVALFEEILQVAVMLCQSEHLIITLMNSSIADIISCNPTTISISPSIDSLTSRESPHEVTLTMGRTKITSKNSDLRERMLGQIYKLIEFDDGMLVDIPESRSSSLEVATGRPLS